MKKIVLISLMTFNVLSAVAAEFMEFGNNDFKSNQQNKSKWIFDLGATYIAYPATFKPYTGAHETIKEEEEYGVYGLGLGFGGEIVYGAGISSTLKLGGFYSKTMNKSLGQAAEDIDLDLANTSDDHLLYGAEASFSLNYLFEGKTLGVQPFIEVAMGTGINQIEKTYDYKGLASSDNPDPEYYQVETKENFNYARTAIGINFISSKGITSYVKVSRVNSVVTKRSFKGTIKDNSQDTKIDEKNSDLNESLDFMMASLGLGFMF